METVLESYTCAYQPCLIPDPRLLWPIGRVPLPFAVMWMEIMSLASEASWLYTATKSRGRSEVLGITLPLTAGITPQGKG